MGSPNTMQINNAVNVNITPDQLKLLTEKNSSDLFDTLIKDKNLEKKNLNKSTILKDNIQAFKNKVSEKVKAPLEELFKKGIDLQSIDTSNDPHAQIIKLIKEQASKGLDFRKSLLEGMDYGSASKAGPNKINANKDKHLELIRQLDTDMDSAIDKKNYELQSQSRNESEINELKQKLGRSEKVGKTNQQFINLAANEKVQGRERLFSSTARIKARYDKLKTKNQPERFQQIIFGCLGVAGGRKALPFSGKTRMRLKYITELGNIKNYGGFEHLGKMKKELTTKLENVVGDSKTSLTKKIRAEFMLQVLDKEAKEYVKNQKSQMENTLGIAA